MRDTNEKAMYYMSLTTSLQEELNQEGIRRINGSKMLVVEGE